MNFLIYLIIFIKFCIILCIFRHLYYVSKGKKDSSDDKDVVHKKEQLEFVFTILMAILLIYIFNPRSTNYTDLDTETRFLFYVFGFILIILADWTKFFGDSIIINAFKNK